MDGCTGQHDEICHRDSDRADKETASMKSSVSSRRSTLKKVAKLIPAIAAADALFLLRADKSVAVTSRPDSSKVILMTGCNSGIGLDATLRFAAQGHRVILACRTKEKAEYAIRQVILQKQLMEVKENDLLIPLECNLASLQSISTFVQNVASTLDGKKIDVVALNAGVARNVASKDVLRTAEGFELTVGTNHFGHFYLANLLLPLVSRIKIRY
jgi:protochlorophyllide reductase